ncbi:hypothetical protein FHS34_007427 [Streptomyces echinatus]|uniref:Tc1-like transposase DDE domain-containing protein n=1 Tax=Streptomyces echinatus TaxID=67293 RepID=A0A7W9Q2G9_9ACTN|nr:hypothetical protein [Streptomyces echinatus]
MSQIRFGQFRVHWWFFWGGPQLDQVALTAAADAEFGGGSTAVQAHPHPGRQLPGGQCERAVVGFGFRLAFFLALLIIQCRGLPPFGSPQWPPRARRPNSSMQKTTSGSPSSGMTSPSAIAYLRSLHPPEVRIAIVLDNNFSPHLTTKKDTRVGDWAAANDVELAYTPTNSSWLNRIEAQFTALRHFALDGTDHASHKEQGNMTAATSSGGTSTPRTNDFVKSSTGPTLPDGHQTSAGRTPSRSTHTHP